MLFGNIQFRLGWAYIRSKIDIQKGIDHMKQAEQILTQNIEVLLKLAGALFKEFDKCQEALTYVDKALVLQYDSSEAWLLKGKLLDKLNKHTESIEAFNQAIKL